MGGSAYDFLANDPRLRRGFGELAAKFQAFADVLAEVSDNSSLRAPTDILRLHENWAKTGSPRSAEQLRRLGLEPSAGLISLRFNLRGRFNVGAASRPIKLRIFPFVLSLPKGGAEKSKLLGVKPFMVRQAHHERLNRS
jgi:hypothetical protein